MDWYGNSCPQARQGGAFADSTGALKQQRSPPRDAAEENVASSQCRTGLPKGASAMRAVRKKLTASPFNGPGSVSVNENMSSIEGPETSMSSCPGDLDLCAFWTEFHTASVTAPRIVSYTKYDS